MTDAPLKKCPECNGPIHRIISSGSGVIFKGSGFHKNNYGHQARCGKDQTCCGSGVPCDTPPCEK